MTSILALLEPLLGSFEPIINIAKTVIGIGGLIFVHELGHFLVGRWCGVRAEAFSIGFGPVLLKWQPGPTEYRLSAIPLGGYVKFLGENPDEQGETAPDSFVSATYPRKAAIMLAGVTMNIIAAFVLFIAVFARGIELPAAEIGALRPGYPAWAAGLEPGDEILEIDGSRILEFFDVANDVAIADEVEILLRRDGEVLPPMRIQTVAHDGIRVLGIEPASEVTDVIRVLPDSAAAKAGFKDGDVVRTVGGDEVSDVPAAVGKWSQTPNAVWQVERDGETVSIELPWGETHRIGVLMDAREIGAIRKGSAAESAGLLTGDVPLRLGDVPITGVSMLEDLLTDDEPDTGPLVVARGADAVEREIALPTDPKDLARGFARPIGGPLYISPYSPDGSPTAAGEAGMTTLSRIVRIGSDDEPTMETLQEATAKAAEIEGGTVDLGWIAADGTAREAKIAPRATPAPESPGFAISLRTKTVQETDVVASIELGVERTSRWVRRVLGTLGSLFSGRVKADKLSGPVAIAKISYEASKNDLSQLMLFLGIISVNLAVLNLLPIPVLDGGQLLLITLEKVRGRPLPQRVLEGVQWAGLLFLLGFMAFVIANDIKNL